MRRTAGAEPAIPPRGWRVTVTPRPDESPTPVPTRAASPYRGLADADPQGIRWPGWTRTSVVPAFKAPSPLPTEQPANGAAVRCRSGPPALQERGRSRARRRECPRCDSNAHCRPPRGRASSRWATRTWSRYPGSNRAVRRTKAEPRAARIGMGYRGNAATLTVLHGCQVGLQPRRKQPACPTFPPSWLAIA